MSGIAGRCRLGWRKDRGSSRVRYPVPRSVVEAPPTARQRPGGEAYREPYDAEGRVRAEPRRARRRTY